MCGAFLFREGIQETICMCPERVQDTTANLEIL